MDSLHFSGPIDNDHKANVNISFIICDLHNTHQGIIKILKQPWKNCLVWQFLKDMEHIENAEPPYVNLIDTAHSLPQHRLGWRVNGLLCFGTRGT